MEFAACLWDLAPEEKTISELAASEVTAIEPGATFLTERDTGLIEQVGRWCRSAGIRIYVCHAPFGGSSDLSHLDPSARLSAISIAQDSLRRAALVGAECMVIHPSGGHIPDEERDTRRQALMCSLEALISSAERTGIRLALENMLPQHVGDSAAEVLEIVQAFDSRWLGVCFDTGHAHLTSDGVVGAFDTLDDRIVTFHLQDNDGNHDRHLQPPYGTIDWGAFVQVGHWDDADFPLSIETLPWKGAGWETMMREVQALFSEGLLSVTLGQRVHVVCQRCGRYRFGTPDSWFCGCETEEQRSV
jgi:sugar phosphate isomerase/epimerase